MSTNRHQPRRPFGATGNTAIGAALPSGSGGPRSLADVLSQLRALRGHGHSQGAQQLAAMWQRIAGPEISEHTKVIGLKNATLQVGVANAALLGELTAFHKQRLLAALRSDSEGQRIKGLKFQLRSS